MKNTTSQTRSTSRKIGRWALWIVGVLVAVTGLLIGILIAMNWRDEALTPEVAAALVEPAHIVPDEQNGFFILKAMDADATVDALLAGRDVVKAEEVRYSADPGRYDQVKAAPLFKKSIRSTWDKKHCAQTLASCVDEVLKNRPALEKKLAENKVILQRYEQMQTLSGFEEHLIPTPESELPSYKLLLDASDMVLTKAVLNIADGDLRGGIAQLEGNERYLRFLLKNTSTLISRMVTVAMVHRQTRIVSELCEKYPALLAQYDDRLVALVQPLGREEQDFTRVFATEARFLKFLLHLKQVSLDGQIADSGEPSWRDRLGSMLYQPNATLNKVMRLRVESIKSANVSASQLSDVRKHLNAYQKDLINELDFPNVRYFYNPVGKILASVALGGELPLLSYQERSADLAAYRRMVSLSIDLRRHHVTQAEFANYIANAAGPFRSPYDGTPFLWDSKAHQLSFVGRQKSNHNLDGGNVFIVRLQ